MLKVHTGKLGDVTVLCLQGQIVTGETSTLRDAVLLQSEASVVVLDLARVSRIDAGGLGVLLELRGQTLSRHIEFRLINVTKMVRRVLEITRLDSVFETSSTESVVSAAEQPRSSNLCLVLNR
jgi:anti-sigma B factor antagonist